MKIFEERKKIYQNFQNYNESLSKIGFLYVYDIDDKSLKELSQSALDYVNKSLSAYYGKEFDMADESDVENNIHEILSMPNVTPNGMFLPKNETAHALNNVQKALSTYLDKICLSKNIERMQTVHVLIKTYEHGTRFTDRPFYTGKAHSDAWPGQQGDAILWLSTLMNESNTLELLEPIDPAPNFFEPATSIDEGQKRYSGLKSIGKATYGTMAILDHSTIHRTYQEISCKPRITISCGVAIKNSSDWTPNQSLEKDYTGSYFSIDELKKVGRSHTFSVEETLEECRKKFSNTNTKERSAFNELTIERN